MFCPRCGSGNGDEVIFCRGCGLDLVEVRVAIVPSGAHPARAFVERSVARQNRRLRRFGIDGTEDALTLEEKAIELNSRGILGLLLGGGFSVFSYFVYSAPPIGGIFWMLPVAFSIFFFSIAISRFVQAGALRRLARPTDRPVALPGTHEDYIKPARSIYQTDDLKQPPSVTDATTRHLNAKSFSETDE